MSLRRTWKRELSYVTTLRGGNGVEAAALENLAKGVRPVATAWRTAEAGHAPDNPVENRQLRLRRSQNGRERAQGSARRVDEIQGSQTLVDAPGEAAPLRPKRNGRGGLDAAAQHEHRKRVAVSTARENVRETGGARPPRKPEV